MPRNRNQQLTVRFNTALPLTTQDQLIRKQSLATSPFQRDEPPPPRIDTSVQLACPHCPKRFVATSAHSAEDNMTVHMHQHR